MQLHNEFAEIYEDLKADEMTSWIKLLYKHDLTMEGRQVSLIVGFDLAELIGAFAF